MSKMKESGIAWVGDMPANWTVKRGKYTLNLLNRPVEDSDEVITCFRDGEVTLRKNRREDGFTVSLKEIGYQGLEPGDLVIHGMDGFAGAIGISDSRGKSSPVLVVCDSDENKKYIMYYLRSMAYNDVFTALATGIRVRSCDLRWNKLAELPYILPSLEEQNKIVQAIDNDTAKVEALIANVQAQIEKLKVYKQTLITEAATKGLDTTVPMKDSGVKYIGRIPSHWIVFKTKRITTDHLQGYYDSDGYTLSGYRLLRITDLLGDGKLSVTNAPYVKETKGINKFVLQQGDFCFARTGGAGLFGFVSEDIEPSVFASYLIRFRFKNQYNPFLKYVFLTYSFQAEIDSLIHGAVNRNVHAENILDTHIAIPPIEEQMAIVSYLDEKCSQIDRLILTKQAKIDKLNEYKKSLIYEYVTGKKEVQ